MTICATCLAGCCRRYNVILTGYDILKITKVLGVEPQFFVDICEVSDDDYQNVLSGKEPLFNFMDNNCKRSYRIKIKKQESSVFKGTKKCIFLNEIVSEDDSTNIIARCSIYSIRPLICAAYPARFVNKSRIAKVPFVFEKDITKKGTALELCKRAFNDGDIGLNHDELINLLVRESYEVEYFASFAEKWNKNPSFIADFWSEMEEVYKKRVFVESKDDIVKYIA